jgi:nucleoside-diphosphate-sugar epimerase
VEYVVHLSYVMPRGQSALEKAMDDLSRNVLGTLRFVQILPDSTLRLCFASSVMVYGLNPPVPVSEADCARPASVYAIGKLATETHLCLLARESGVPLSILRYATVYGPMETVPRAVPNFIRQVLAGKAPVIYGRGDDVRDYVHVRDVVDATLLALVHSGSTTQVYNVGTGTGHTTRDIAERTVGLAGKHVTPVYEPSTHAANEIVCDITHASRALGYKPQVELDAGLADEIRYFARNPRLWREEQ